MNFAPELMDSLEEIAARRPLRLAYVSIQSSDDVNAWSGLNYNIAQALRRAGVDVHPVPALYNNWRTFISKVKAAILTAVTGKRHLWSRDPQLLHYYAQRTARLLEEVECDAIFSPGTESLAYLPEVVRLPIVFWTDAPFGAMVDYYAWYQNLAEASIQQGMECDNRAIRRSLFALYSSTWAAEAAVRIHGGSTDQVHVVPFGANLNSALDAATVEHLVESRLRRPWRFLFVGVEWERKGGDIVLAVVSELNRLGYPSELCIVGCTPPASVPLPSFVTCEGFINKRTEEGCRKMAELYRSSTFYFMPSRAEAYGIVFCEASAHGLPSLTTDTGGIPTIIRDRYNGRLFDLDAPLQAYVDAILESVQPHTYKQLCANAISTYESRLCWEASSRRVVELLQDALQLQSA